MPEHTRLDFESRRLPPMIRASVHCFNTTDEVDRFCETLVALSSLGTSA
jgi:selenocysteine lyase/cysteine desulfurase